MSKSIYDLAKEALDVQNACNLTAVAQSFARAMIDLGKHVQGTYAVRTHPITLLWVDKLASLTGTQQMGLIQVMNAYDAVNAIVNAPDLVAAQ